jgi:hypothetical protein
MKNFEQPYQVWLEMITSKVQWADAEIGRLKAELEAIRKIRDTWASSTFPGGLKSHWVLGESGASVKESKYKWREGMEDCGK